MYVRRLLWLVGLALGACLAGPWDLLATDAIVRLSFTVGDRARRADTATLQVGSDAGPVLAAELRLAGAVVTPAHDPEQALRINRRLGPGPHELMLKVRGAVALVVLDRCTVGALAGLPDTGPLAATFTPGTAIAADDKVRVQRLAPVLFSDDFAREGDVASQWDAVGGRFALCTSLNPGSSQSAFQLWASAPTGRGVALAAASRWFWDDTVNGVSAMAPALPAAWGLVLHAAGTDDYYAALWRQETLEAPGTVAIVRHRAGVDTLLAQAPLAMVPGQWYRMTVLTCGSRARVFVGGSQVVQAEDPGLVGGRMGLLAERSEDLYFDDVEVRSALPRMRSPGWSPEQPFGPCEQTWSDFSKKSFYTDPFMVQWAHPRCAWERDGAAGLHWFRTRFFHDVRVSWTRSPGQTLQWPGKDLTVLVFGDRGSGLDTGYRLTLRAGQVALARNGAEVAVAPLTAKELDRLDVTAGAGTVTLAANGQDVLGWQDPQPLLKGEVGLLLGPDAGMDLGNPDWRDTVQLQSSHRLDYSFDHAPTAWAIGAGHWQGDHRWACTPNWSFFAGRGEAGPPECDNGTALLWNLRRFAGDFDMEVFAAPLEATPQRMHYADPVTVNLSFMGDGRNLDSGYLCLFGTYDIPSQLFRDGVPIAEWRGRLNPGLRRQEEPWYQHVTRVWQHLRVCRRGARITIDAARHDDEANDLGLERIFDVSEETLPAGDRMGAWTWGPNGLAIARVTVSFEHSPGTAPAALPETPTEEVRGGRGEPRRFVRVRNPQPGGFFHHDLQTAPRDLDEAGTVQFEARLPNRAVLSLIARVRGQTAEAELTGPDAYRPYTIPLGRAEATPSKHYPGWTVFRVDLRQALRRAFPQGPLVLERLAVSSPYDGVAQIAGLGMNRCGDAYDLAEADWSASPALPPAEASCLQVLVYNRRPLDDFEADIGTWERLGGRDGAILYRDPHEPSTGQHCLRLLNPVIGGPAGAWVTREPYPLAAFPRLRFDYRLGPDTELNLLVEVDGRTVEVTFTGTDSSWPVVGQVPQGVADGQWHSAEVDLAAMLQAQPGNAPQFVTSLALADSRRMSTSQRTACWIDNFCLVPAVDPQGPTSVSLALSDGTVPTAHRLSLDDKPDTDPGQQPSGEGSTAVIGPNVTGTWLHARGRRADGTWTPPVHLPLAVQRPSLPAVPAPSTAPTGAIDGPPAAPQVLYIPSDRLLLNRFDWAACPRNPDSQFGEACIRREAWVLRGEGDGVADAGCIILQNLDAQGFYSAYLRRSGWDPLRWPMVSFDYRFEQPGCALNLAMMVNGAMTIVEWTGVNPPGSHFTPAVIGRTEPAIQDGSWHHVAFDLGEMLLATRFAKPETRARITVSELATWAAYHVGLPGSPDHARVRVDNLCIYSDRGADPAFAWAQPPGSPQAQGYAVIFDQKAESVPPEAVTTTATQGAYPQVAPGDWSLHVRARNERGWGPTAHRTLRILPAATPP